MSAAAVAQSWRLPLAALAAAVRRRRAGIRVAPISQAWLREHDAECAKHSKKS